MGKIIVIEGTDCSGKETQSKLLEKRLKEMGKKCIRFDFPMYDTPTGKIVGGCYLGKEEIGKSVFPEGAVNVDPHVVSLYYAADRKYNMSKIEEYLDKDYYVLLDRYVTSNLAHQGTIFLHVPYQYTLELRKNRTSIDEHEKSVEHLMQAEEAYVELSQLYHWDTIECIKDGKLRTIEDINDEILEAIEKEPY